MSHSALSWAPPPAWQADNSKPRVNAQPTRQALEQRRGLIFEGTPAVSHHLGAYPRPHPATYRPCHASSSDRKSTRLNSSHVAISYAVFCLKKKIQVIP